MSRNSGAMASSAGGGRGRLSATGMIDFTRPGRLVKTTTMSERKIASCRSWVTNSTVRLLRSHTERNSACSNSRVWLSSAPNGSSINRISGSMANVRATDALAHALRQFVAVMVLELVEADPAQPFAGDGAAIGDAAHFEAKLDVLGRGAPRHHAVAGEHVADVVADAVDLGAVDLGKARARLQQAGDDVEQGRLAATRRPDDGDDGTVGHVERHAAHRLDRAAVARPEYDADIRQADFCRRGHYSMTISGWSARPIASRQSKALIATDSEFFRSVDPVKGAKRRLRRSGSVLI